MKRFKRQSLDKVKFNLSVTMFKQGNEYVVYVPALDISTYGGSKVDAQKNFEELVDSFFLGFDDARELGQVLESMGWTKQKSAWQPPKIELRSVSVPAALMSV